MGAPPPPPRGVHYTNPKARKNMPVICHKGLRQIEHFDDVMESDFWKENERKAYDRRGK